MLEKQRTELKNIAQNNFSDKNMKNSLQLRQNHFLEILETLAELISSLPCLLIFLQQIRN